MNNHWRLLFSTTLTLLACTTINSMVVPATPITSSPATRPAIVTAPASVKTMVVPPVPNTTSTPPPAPEVVASIAPLIYEQFVVVALSPEQGPLAEVLPAEIQKAYDQGLTPYVEFTAEWCGPCRALRQSLRDEDPLMLDAFKGTYIIQLDVDAWQDQLADNGYTVEVIPIFFGVNSDGWPTEHTINGGAWGEDIPENMAPPLKEFFSGR